MNIKDKNFFKEHETPAVQTPAEATPARPIRLPPAPRQIAQTLWFRTHFGYVDGWLLLLIAVVPLWINFALPGNGLAPLAHLPGKSSELTVEIFDCMKNGGEYICNVRGASLPDVKSRVDYSPATYGPEASSKKMTVLQFNNAPGIIANPDFSLYKSTLVLFGISAFALLLSFFSFLRNFFIASRELDLIRNGTAVPGVFLKTEPELPTTSQTYEYICAYSLPNAEQRTASRTIQNIQLTRRFRFSEQEGEVLAIPRKYSPAEAGAMPLSDLGTGTPTGGQEIVLYNPANPRQAALFNVPGYDLETDMLGQINCPGSPVKLRISALLALAAGLLFAGACIVYLNSYLGAR